LTRTKKKHQSNYLPTPKPGGTGAAQKNYYNFEVCERTYFPTVSFKKTKEKKPYTF